MNHDQADNSRTTDDGPTNCIRRADDGQADCSIRADINLSIILQRENNGSRKDNSKDGENSSGNNNDHRDKTSRKCEAT